MMAEPRFSVKFNNVFPDDENGEPICWSQAWRAGQRDLKDEI